jgi:hypothetical protein
MFLSRFRFYRCWMLVWNPFPIHLHEWDKLTYPSLKAYPATSLPQVWLCQIMPRICFPTS